MRCLLLLSLLSSVGAAADERRQSTRDTSRDSVPTGQSVSPKRDAATGRLSVGAPQRTLQEEIDPAVRQYWSSKCVQQRERGWGHTGDCTHPAYSGSGYGAAPIVVVPYGYPPQQRDRGRGQIRMPPPGSGYRGHLR